ncbi:MAG: hypothetical protein HOH66_00245 [Rhodospirillaceae bacterium]|nr:hypothetical protein [Rhodospirillaceae bacterium]MBT6116278.1 hypothetical protein [Rhodospirillaceae bacterium]
MIPAGAAVTNIPKRIFSNPAPLERTGGLWHDPPAEDAGFGDSFPHPAAMGPNA